MKLVSGGKQEALTLGALGPRLIANGYQPRSALVPYGYTWGDYPQMFAGQPDAHVVSEHPVVVACGGNLAALLLQPAGEDAELARRVRSLLSKLTSGPVRFGSDGVALYPLRYAGDLSTKTTLEGAVTFACRKRGGPSAVPVPVLIPLDGRWVQGDLTGTPLTKLPHVDDAQISELVRQLSALPFELSEERRPPAKPHLLGWLNEEESA